MTAAGRQRDRRSTDAGEPERARLSGGSEHSGGDRDPSSGGRANSGFGRWRNWRIPVKLAAAVLVPVIFAVSLGVVQIYDQVQQAQRYDEISRLVSARNRIQPLLTGLQKERTRAAELLAGSASDARAYRKQAKRVTVFASKAPGVLEDVKEFSSVTAAQFGDLRKQLARLPKLRKRVLTSNISPAAAVQAYSDIVSSLLSLERAVINTIGDAELYSTVSALLELSRAEDEIRIQRALVVAGLSKSDFTPALMDAINDSRARLRSRLTGFKAAAAPAQRRDFTKAINNEDVQARRQALDALVAAVGTTEPDEVKLTLPEWSARSEAVIKSTSVVRSALSEDLQRRTYKLSENSSDRAGAVTVLLFSALVLATAVMFLIARNLLGSLALLRRSALDAADHQLPQAVSRIRRNEDSEDETEVPAVPVATTEEIGQVARAFDEVNRQALYLASEQADLRRGYSDSFVNVSRRSQSLLERQLRLFEQLEQDEDDPDQLATLFRLDHLATRMRRNNENLMVLSGSDMARRFNQPAPLSDVLRAAVSEIEHYPRVVVQSPPTAQLVGYAASDLVRLMAELLDNAANFSAPNTSVTVSSHQAHDSSITVDVLDSGIGMDDTELEQANEQLASFDEYDLSTSRRMGLLVIARLAGRHGITVRLYGGEEFDGVRASVSVPADLVVGDGTSQQPPVGPSQPAPQPSGPPSSVPQPSVPQSSAIEQQLSPRQSAPEQGSATNGAKQEIPSVGSSTQASGTSSPRANGAPRRQVLQGGLPQHALGGEAPAEPANEPAAPREPAAPQEPAVPQEPQAAPPSELEPRGRVRGLFEPPARPDEEFVEQETTGTPPDGFLPSDMPEQRRSNEPTTSSGVDTGGVLDQQQRRPEPTEILPVFSETAAQWFQPSEENAHYQAEAQRADSEGQSWPSPDDSAGSSGDGSPWGRSGGEPTEASEPATSWAFDTRSSEQHAGPAPRAEPTGYTASGLPRRTPREQLGDGGAEAGESDSPAGAASIHEQADTAQVQQSRQDPVSAGPDPLSPSGQWGRSQQDPDDLRGRLSNFQQGARRSQPDSDDRSEPDTSAQHERSVSDGDSAWNFSTDRAQQEAEAAANPQPSDYTSAGLPRRTPRAHLAPGSVAPSGGDSADKPQNQQAPDEMRGRLSSFQQGVRRGRHSAGD